MEILEIKKIFLEVVTTIPGVVCINPIDENCEISDDNLVNYLSVKKEDNNSYNFTVDMNILLGVNVNNLTRRIYKSLLYRFNKINIKINNLSIFISEVIYE